MSALAELCVLKGARVSGSDTAEIFPTDRVLREARIAFAEGFDAGNVPNDAEWVIYSGAYRPSTNVELLHAARLGIPMLEYSEAVGALSRGCVSAGITGTHGKSTTTAMTGTLLAALGLDVSVLVAAGVADFGGHPVFHAGDIYFVAESDEYRRHFLSFRPTRIVMTSVEFDHPDYFGDLEDVIDAFLSYAELLPTGGELIYCRDDAGAARVASVVRDRRRDIRCVPYGATAEGAFLVREVRRRSGAIEFRLGERGTDVELRVPGDHNVLNATASIALASSLCVDDHGEFTENDLAVCLDRLVAFRGTTRRSEVVGERNGVLVMDDYGHHPTAVRKTIAGLRDFYPARRVVVDFMPHTYSRTAALFDEFVAAFDRADMLILHPVYSSARETSGRVSGFDLYKAVSDRRDNVFYFDDYQDAFRFLVDALSPGDLFLTLGAGDNWKLGRMLLEGRNV